ncbi:ABC transporter permease [Streptomyces griseorubiginosus]|uniref:ABC transporter permease n=1 Tax=Streptomyces griseorubiginosus TaxID=67304 RepID=UPI001140938E|nr:ABC transporter permease [Streptomyces griseorubiginosus]
MSVRGLQEREGFEGRDEDSGAGAAESSPAPGRHGPRVTWRQLTLLPAFLVAVLLATWLWFARADLDPVSAKALSNGRVSEALWQHVRLTVISTLLVLVIAIPPGILLARRAFGGGPTATAVVLTGRAVPAIGLLALLVIRRGTGTEAALAGITAFALLPVLSHTVASLRAHDPAVVPGILAGVRTALVLDVGTATLAAFGGGGGLGSLIATGIATGRMPVLILSSVLTVTLALLVDWLASLAELLSGPRGYKESDAKKSMQKRCCKGPFA